MTRSLTALFLCMAAAAQAAPMHYDGYSRTNFYGAWSSTPTQPLVKTPVYLAVERSDTARGPIHITRLEIGIEGSPPYYDFGVPSVPTWNNTVELGGFRDALVIDQHGVQWSTTIYFNEFGSNWQWVMTPRQTVTFTDISGVLNTVQTVRIFVPEPSTWQLVLLGLVAWPAGVLLRRFFHV